MPRTCGRRSSFRPDGGRLADVQRPGVHRARATVNAQQVITAFGARSRREAPTTFGLGTIWLRATKPRQEMMWPLAGSANAASSAPRATHWATSRETGRAFFPTGGRGSLDARRAGPADFTRAVARLRGGSQRIHRVVFNQRATGRSTFTSDVRFACSSLRRGELFVRARSRDAGQTGADTVLAISTRVPGRAIGGRRAGRRRLCGSRASRRPPLVKSRRRPAIAMLAGLLWIATASACGGGGRPPTGGTRGGARPCGEGVPHPAPTP